jgi:hypothetical protein
MSNHREIKDEELVQIQDFADADAIGGTMVAAMAKELLEHRAKAKSHSWFKNWKCNLCGETVTALTEGRCSKCFRSNPSHREPRTAAEQLTEAREQREFEDQHTAPQIVQIVADKVLDDHIALNAGMPRKDECVSEFLSMLLELKERRRVDRLIAIAWGKDHMSVVDGPALSAAVNAIPR